MQGYVAALLLLSGLRAVHADECLAGKVVLAHCFIKGCFWGHGENVWCDGTNCLCKRGYCTTNNQTCVKIDTTTENPNPSTYECDAIGFQQMSRDIKPGGRLFKVITRAIGFNCAGEAWDTGAIPKCCAAKTTRDTVSAKAPGCWETYPKFRNYFETTVAAACPGGKKGKPGMMLSATVEDALMSSEDGFVLSDAELGQLHEGMMRVAEDALRDQHHPKTSRGLSLASSGIVGMSLMVLVAGFVALEHRRRMQPSMQEAVYEPLVE